MLGVRVGGQESRFGGMCALAMEAQRTQGSGKGGYRSAQTQLVTWWKMSQSHNPAVLVVSPKGRNPDSILEKGGHSECSKGQWRDRQKDRGWARETQRKP